MVTLHPKEREIVRRIWKENMARAGCLDHEISQTERPCQRGDGYCDFNPNPNPILNPDPGFDVKLRDLESCAENWESAKTAEHYRQLELNYKSVANRLDPESNTNHVDLSDIAEQLQDAREDLEQSRRYEAFGL